MFRSAAYAYGDHVIGVILSGALDDGTAGLWAVKKCGGLAVVQDPGDADVPAMPQNALDAVKVDHKVPMADMAHLLTELIGQEIDHKATVLTKEEKGQMELEVDIAIQDEALEKGILHKGKFTPFTCPECQGVLSSFMDENRMRYRCHTGHAYSVNSLLEAITENIGNSIWGTIRGIEESMMLLNHLGDHFAEVNQPRLAASYFQKAKTAEKHLKALRTIVMDHELLNQDSVEIDASIKNNNPQISNNTGK
jgi:two-component system chemotaxis response regulator CheB